MVDPASQPSLAIGIIGTGLVGGELLSQLLAPSSPSDLQVIGVLASKLMYLGTPTRDWKHSNRAVPRNLDAFIDHLTDHGHAVVVDCTCDQTIADAYPTFQQQGLWVVTASKLGVAGPASLYNAINHARFYHESSCGAGLPVLCTIKSLVDSVDTVTSIKGIMSGSLGYLLSHPDLRTKSFKDLVNIAKDLGFTEPDPREDLSGMDVARKVLILARACGKRQMELADIDVTAVCPKDVMEGEGNVDGFMQRLDGFALQDPGAGKVSRFVGTADLQNGVYKACIEA